MPRRGVRRNGVRLSLRTFQPRRKPKPGGHCFHHCAEGSAARSSARSIGPPARPAVSRNGWSRSTPMRSSPPTTTRGPSPGRLQCRHSRTCGSTGRPPTFRPPWRASSTYAWLGLGSVGDAERPGRAQGRLGWGARLTLGVHTRRPGEDDHCQSRRRARSGLELPVRHHTLGRTRLSGLGRDRVLDPRRLDLRQEPLPRVRRHGPGQSVEDGDRHAGDSRRLEDCGG